MRWGRGRGRGLGEGGRECLDGFEEGEGGGTVYMGGLWYGGLGAGINGR